jgi:hypothetical protein
MGVRLWQADQFLGPTESGSPPLLALQHLTNLVSRYEVCIDDVRAWATIGTRKVCESISSIVHANTSQQ